MSEPNYSDGQIVVAFIIRTCKTMIKVQSTDLQSKSAESMCPASDIIKS